MFFACHEVRKLRFVRRNIRFPGFSRQLERASERPGSTILYGFFCRVLNRFKHVDGSAEICEGVKITSLLLVI